MNILDRYAVVMLVIAIMCQITSESNFDVGAVFGVFVGIFLFIVSSIKEKR